VGQVFNLRPVCNRPASSFPNARQIGASAPKWRLPLPPPAAATAAGVDIRGVLGKPFTFQTLAAALKGAMPPLAAQEAAD
jgi:hypothetical protein